MSSFKRSVSIIGGGQAGLQLGCGLLQHGYEVQILQNRSADEVRAGRVMSTQCMFDAALQNERDVGLNFWDDVCPAIDSLHFSVPAPGGSGQKAIDWKGALARPAQSVDQRVKFPAWMREFERRGGNLQIKEANIEDLEAHAKSSDLVIVACGKGEIARLFERDPERSPFEKPKRNIAVAYVNGLAKSPDGLPVTFNMIPTVGEFFTIPALTVSGPCDILIFECIPGGPMDDCWRDAKTPAEHLASAKRVLDTFVPWEASRCRDIELTDENGILKGAFAPTVRKPVGRLPSGALVLGMADALVLNDPITGQGSNNASKCARHYMDAILSHGERPFDEAFMQSTFDAFWGYAQYVVGWTNAMLEPPPPHVLKLMGAAQGSATLAARIANGFNHPPDLFPWFAVPEEAERVLASLTA